MATAKTNGKFNHCDVCGNTGILEANLVKNAETKANEKIVVKPCGRHYNSDLTTKSIRAMEATGLQVEVVETDKKKE